MHFAAVYKVVGAASMLGGVTRMMLSITVLAMEGSGSLQMIVPLMVAVTVAKIVGDSLTLPIYDMQIKIRGAPVLVRALPLQRCYHVCECRDVTMHVSAEMSLCM